LLRGISLAVNDVLEIVNSVHSQTNSPTNGVAMPTKDHRAAAFHQARTDLRALLAASNLAQKDLAAFLGIGQSTLSARLSSNRVSIFELIADKFPPASWVTARLYARLAGVYLQVWESMAQGPEDDLREAIKQMEQMINEAAKR